MTEIAKGPFEPTWESLRAFETPQWFLDAKLGIWSHWGPQSVPMFGDWYARHMYIQGHVQNLYHRRHYGHPSKVGFKDIARGWKAENFDPDGLMDLYVKAGAKYFVAQAVHHDNFDNWDSKHHKWNSVNEGPKKDIVGLWGDAARKRGLRFGVTEHLGATYKWFSTNKDSDATGPYAGVPYDGADPANEDYYLPNQGETLPGWYTDNAWWHERWLERMVDLVDQHKPDLFYSDGAVPFNRPQDGLCVPQPGLDLVSHLYNTSATLNGGVNQAVYNQKDKNEEVYTIGVLDIERGMQREIAKHPWQTDTCVGGWFYDVKRVYKTPKLVIDMLINIVSKNGCMLLNFTQRPDGTLDDECLHILDCMAAWTEVNGEGIHETRPWGVAGEGPNLAPVVEGRFKEEEQTWEPEDFRFTAKGDTVYAFAMGAPRGGGWLIREMAGEAVKNARVLGAEETPWQMTPAGLWIAAPAKRDERFAQGIRIDL